MSNIHRRLNKAEKQLRIEEPHLITVMGVEMSSDSFKKLLKEINGKSKGVLPCQEEHREYQAREQLKGQSNV